MSDAPSPPPPPPDGEGPSRRPGIAAGVVTTLALAFVAILLIGNTGELAVGLIAVALLVAAALVWRKMPGFLLGIAWAIGVSAIVFTACTAILVSAFR